MSFSQCGQDRFIDANVFQGEAGGVFVDIGAYDGVTISNTFLFERDRGWNGVCVEPTPETFAKLRAARRCTCIEGAVAPEAGTQTFTLVTGELDVLSGLTTAVDASRIKAEIHAKGGETRSIDVKCYTIDDVMQIASLAKVDYLSIDTEGHELAILRTIDFRRYAPRCISVEENGRFFAIHRLLRSHGYRLAEKIGPDLIYVSRSQAKAMGAVGLLKFGALPMRIINRLAKRALRKIGVSV